MKLLQHFKTMKGIQEATVEEIQKLGISEKVAKRIKESVKKIHLDFSGKL